jgi:hypothetical protein
MQSRGDFKPALERVLPVVALAIAASALSGCSKSNDASNDGGSTPKDGGHAGSGSTLPCNQPSCPEVLYDRGTSPPTNPRRGVEVDDQDIYWCEIAAEGNVVRAATKVGGGTIRTLGQWYDFAAGRSLVVDQSHVYWLRPDGTGVLVRVNKDGTEPTTIALPLPSDGTKLDLGPIEDAGTSVVIATASCSHAIDVPKAGGEPILRSVGDQRPAGGVTGLTADDRSFYCSNGAKIFAISRSDGSVRELAGDQFLAGPLKLVGGDLFFMDDNGDAGSPNTALRVLRGLAGSPVDLGSFQARAARFLYDESRGRFYWASGLHWAVGKVLTYEMSGGAAPAVLFQNQDVMGSSTSDAEYIYWLSNNAVTRLKKL